MDDLLGGIAEIICYLTGRLLLPMISLGRIRVAPLREPIGRARSATTRSLGDIVVGEGWCKLAGFLFWAFVVLVLVLVARAGT